MRQKLFKKYFGATALIVFISFSTILFILTFVYNNYLAEEKYKVLEKSCDSVATFLETSQTDADIQNNENTLYYIMSNIAVVSELDIYITDTEGVIKICGCKDWEESTNCDHFGSQLDVGVLVSAAENGKKIFSDLGIYNVPRYIATTPLPSSSDEGIGYIVAADTMNKTQGLLDGVARLYIISAIIPVVLMFFALYIMTYRLTRPLKLMSEAAKAMAKGDFSKRIPVTSDDEIGELAVSFNQMTNSLARLEEMRKSFVGNISHEFRTPLTTIGGFIDGIIDSTIAPEKQEYYLQIVSDEVKRLSRMVQSMLNVAQLESGETTLRLESYDFREQILNIVIGQEQRFVKKQLNVVGLDEMANVTITADKDLIYRAVYNLVDNAIKFTQENGTITFNLKTSAKTAVFRIENTGKGIPENELPFVFDRFYKTDKSRSANKDSTGLGLYLVKTIIKNHYGTINVSSVEDKFTAFEFTLPINM